MRAQGDGGICRGATGEPMPRATPACWTMRDFIVYREGDPERARQALRLLVKVPGEGRRDAICGTDFVEAVVYHALTTPPDKLSLHPLDKPMSSWVSDLVWEENRRRDLGALSESGNTAPSPPKGWKWEDLRRAFHLEANRWVHAHKLLVSDAADFAGLALLRLVQERTRGREIRSPLGWARKVFVSLARDMSRGKAEAPSSTRVPSLKAVGRHVATQRNARSTEHVAAGRETAAQAPEFLDQFPPPYREIARLQYLLGLSRREIAAWLKKWRHIRNAGTRKLLLRTHEMLKAIGRGQDPRTLWPGRYNPKKNPWISCPPPPIPPL